jgi:hypothetical protein
MQIQLSTPITSLSGQTLKEGGIELTLRVVAEAALLADDAHISASEKVARFALAVRLHEAGDSIDLQIEDVAKIKEAIGRYMTTLVVGRAFALLEKARA